MSRKPKSTNGRITFQPRGEIGDKIRQLATKESRSLEEIINEGLKIVVWTREEMEKGKEIVSEYNDGSDRTRLMV